MEHKSFHSKAPGNRKTFRRRARERLLDKVNLDAAGIDVGSEAHWIAVPEDRDETPVRKFSSFTHDLHRLADWLEQCHVDTVAMESTGVYWIPLFEILEERGLNVLLVNARHLKNVPGRKHDMLDCQWIQRLHTFGLLRGSFRPAAEITALRSLVRHRDTLIEQAASWVQRMQKALILMNLQLHNVISDITGVTGMNILRDIIAGERDPQRLARHRDHRCKASQETIAASLTGHYREEHVFLLRQALELHDLIQEKVRACDQEIETHLRALQANVEAPNTPLPEPRKSRRKPRDNDPRFDIRSPLFHLCGGVDITKLPGIGPANALKLVSEVGLDMSRWPSPSHFTSWMTLAPHHKVTGGKILSSRTLPSANRAAAIFRMAAMSVGRSENALGAFYRRMCLKTAKGKAITATARKIAVLFYRMLKDKLEYRDITASEYDLRQRRRILRSLRRRAQSMGFQLVDVQTGEVLTGTVS